MSDAPVVGGTPELEGNWHAIEGPNGRCACGPVEGCPERLQRFIRMAIDFWHAKANFLERERERALAELPDAWQRVDGSLAAKIQAYREFVTPYVLVPRPEPSLEPEETLAHAAKLLTLELTDAVLESLRAEWGNTNVVVLRHWRDVVSARVERVAESAPSRPQPLNAEGRTLLSTASGLLKILGRKRPSPTIDSFLDRVQTYLSSKE